MKYKFEYDILHHGIGESKGIVEIDLTETEVILYYGVIRSKDTILMSKMQSRLRNKARELIEEQISIKYSNRPYYQGVFMPFNKIQDEVIRDAAHNPLSDTIKYFLEHADSMEKELFYDGIREYDELLEFYKKKIVQ